MTVLTAARSIERRTLPGAREGRLLYAQVHEDPRLELEALAPAFDGTIAVVGSGGCTVLSLLAAGAQDVFAVDLNPVQNHLVELKAAACRELGACGSTEFLGGWSIPRGERLTRYRQLRRELTGAARRYWDARTPAIAGGVLGCGVSERFMAGLAAVLRALIHPQRRIERLLACRTLEEQEALYHGEWNSIRWRLLFKLLLTRHGVGHTYDAALCSRAGLRSFGAHFHALFERALTMLPVADNYFLHQALLGRYPIGGRGALPPYLAGPLRGEQLTLVDAAFADFLRSQPEGSISGFALSNICEWLDLAGTDALFGEIVRTAAPGAVLCFRNFVGWTEVPERWRASVVEDRLRGAALLARDRSLVNRRFAVCTVLPEPR
ncbi:MAG TPA: DUF3419 family protein [Gemmatimonadales bacterium]|jgi:S-adenosylmethionine-diacylglycerol 3-amino-3-carboxypropyl transferase|nr:DUF3419 family protein [Gemmatimonadales bacterium]